jgi:hypothetical protein
MKKLIISLIALTLLIAFVPYFISLWPTNLKQGDCFKFRDSFLEQQAVADPMIIVLKSVTFKVEEVGNYPIEGGTTVTIFRPADFESDIMGMRSDVLNKVAYKVKCDH